MDLRGLKRRFDVLAALAVVAASIVLAIAIDRAPYTGSCMLAPCPPNTDYPVGLRLAILAGGLLLATLIIAIGKYVHRHDG